MSTGNDENTSVLMKVIIGIFISNSNIRINNYYYWIIK